ncbi:unnamed protein product [Medioppia subpectinata]|uniref:Mitochondrial inner membrane protein Mpv17 n=1 Tax=Medioppia subpectinata TaxID=1979941 RepID=A0A7R9KK11_9ACAR|nr:unnamed protein product [Medioppia subpectinata]CAG2105124.1 unnamed protein product [Medioppia subpectinata]
MLMRVFGVYNRLLKAYPLITQCTTTGVLVGTGDVIAQKGLEKRHEMNWKRTAKFAAFGLLCLGPTNRYMFLFLERVYGTSGTFTPIKKLLTEQLFFLPLIQLAFIGVLGALNGHSLAQMEARIRNDYWDIMCAVWKVWPFVSLVNYYFIALNYRGLVIARDVSSEILGTFRAKFSPKFRERLGVLLNI